MNSCVTVSHSLVCSEWRMQCTIQTIQVQVILVRKLQYRDRDVKVAADLIVMIEQSVQQATRMWHHYNRSQTTHTELVVQGASAVYTGVGHKMQTVLGCKN